MGVQVGALDAGEFVGEEVTKVLLLASDSDGGVWVTVEVLDERGGHTTRTEDYDAFGGIGGVAFVAGAPGTKKSFGCPKMVEKNREEVKLRTN